MTLSLPAPATRVRMPGWALAAGLLVAFVALAAVATVGSLLAFDLTPVHVVIDGTDHFSFDFGSLSTGQKLAMAAGLLVALLVVLVVVPVALLIGLAALAIGLVLGLGVPLLVGLLLLALALSPLLLIVWLAVWLWRRSAAPTTKVAA
jgi:hypothetical protein